MDQDRKKCRTPPRAGMYQAPPRCFARAQTGICRSVGAPDIRQAVRADLRAIVRSFGQETYFRDRLSKQEAGHGVLLVAWERDVAVGDVYVWLAPAEEPELR